MTVFKFQSDENTPLITLTVNGCECRVPEGTSVASVILTQEQPYSRTTPVSGKKRAPYCMMGVCYDCLVVIDGQANQRACLTAVREGMIVETQLGTGPELAKI